MTANWLGLFFGTLLFGIFVYYVYKGYKGKEPLRPVATARSVESSPSKRSLKRNHYQSEEAMSYAGFWKRFAAFFIDFIITTIGCIVVVIWFGIMFGGGTLNTAAWERMGSFFGFIIVWLYYALMESSPKQGTFGKMALGIKVTDLNGNKIGFGKATGRYLGMIISSFILCIGFIMVAFTQKKQGLHDMMAGCLVVNSEVQGNESLATDKYLKIRSSDSELIGKREDLPSEKATPSNLATVKQDKGDPMPMDITTQNTIPTTATQSQQKTELNEEAFYTQAWDEVNDPNRTPNKATWAKAFSFSLGDEKKTQAKYIELRVAQLQEEHAVRLLQLKAKREEALRADKEKAKSEKMARTELRALVKKVQSHRYVSDAKDLIVKLGGTLQENRSWFSSDIIRVKLWGETHEAPDLDDFWSWVREEVVPRVLDECEKAEKNAT